MMIMREVPDEGTYENEFTRWIYEIVIIYYGVQKSSEL